MGEGYRRRQPLDLFQHDPALAVILVVIIAAAIIAVLIWSYRQDAE